MWDYVNRFTHFSHYTAMMLANYRGEIYAKCSSAAYRIPKSQFNMASMKKIDVPDVRSKIQTEFESNLDYHRAADKIITVSRKYLENQQRNKTELRKKLAKLFSVLLIVEYAFMVIFILADAVVAITVE